MSVYDVLTLALEAVRNLALTAQEAQANSVKAGNDWAAAAQEAGVFATARSADITAYAFGWITVTTEALGDDLARVAELLAAEVSTYPTCEHCGSPDLHAVGDFTNLVAVCQPCDVMTCRTCWDRFHAETCRGDGTDVFRTCETCSRTLNVGSVLGPVPAHSVCERCRHSSGPFEVVGILEYDASTDELLYPAWTERPYGYADEDGDRDG